MEELSDGHLGVGASKIAPKPQQLIRVIYRAQESDCFVVEPGRLDGVSPRNHSRSAPRIAAFAALSSMQADRSCGVRS